MCNLLFAYGTLLSRDTGATGRAQRARLAREALWLGPATTCGLLYDLGRYPGLVLTDGGETVHGELVELTDPARSLAWLDAYEGIVPGQHPHNDYERRLRSVRLRGDEALHAWVYVFRASVAAARLIPEGRWSGSDPAFLLGRDP